MTAVRYEPECAERPQTLGEEIANAVSHGVGALLAVACLAVGVVFASLEPYRDVWNIVSVAVYGTTMVLLYLFSTLYHALNRPKTKAVLNYFDHASIYLLIAGSYTPFCLGAIRHFSPAWAWSIFGIEWGFAILGIAFQCFFINRFVALSNLTYLVMGWVVLAAVYPLWKAMGAMPVFWIAVGGVLYSLGVVFYVMKRTKWMHFVWHLFVLAGTLVQYFVVLFCIVLNKR
jgi:hemolysin III